MPNPAREYRREDRRNKNCAALDDLRHDHDYLLAGGVFTEDIIEVYIETKMEYGVRALDRRPHPREYILYFDM